MSCQRCPDGKFREDGIEHTKLPFARYNFDINELMRWIDNPMRELVDSVVEESKNLKEDEFELALFAAAILLEEGCIGSPCCNCSIEQHKYLLQKRRCVDCELAHQLRMRVEP